MVARRSDIEAGRFTNPADCRAARITIPPAGRKAMAGSIREQALQKGGLTLADVELVPADLPAQAEALATGQTDLVYTVEPWITRAVSNPDADLNDGAWIAEWSIACYQCYNLNRNKHD